MSTPPTVSLVIPGKNAVRTIDRCLAAVAPLVESGDLSEIVFVNDGSTDDTAERAAAYPVRVLSTPGLGPAGARNIGWRAAASDLIWFIDSDCVAEPDALARLVGDLTDPRVAGISGSYLNAEPNSYLSWLIHEEIVARHAAIGASRVTHLGTFNVLYRRAVLDEVGGLDEKAFPGVAAEDADLSFRIVDAGYDLRLDPSSLVAHFHPTRVRPYWRSQATHGYWAVRLLRRHPRRADNSYNSFFDNLQVPLALVCALTLPALFWPVFRPWAALPWIVLLLLTFPLTARLLGRTKSLRALGYPVFCCARAFPRALGMLRGVVALGRDTG